MWSGRRQPVGPGNAFTVRLGAQAPRWSVLGVNFYARPPCPGSPERVSGVLRLTHVQESGSARNNGMNSPEHVGENNVRRAFDD